MKNHSLPEADLEVKQQRGIRKAKCDALQSLLCVGDEGSVVRKENVPDQPLLGLGVGLYEHHAEEDAEESGCRETTLLHTVGDGKELRQVTIESDLVALVLLQLDHHQ